MGKMAAPRQWLLLTYQLPARPSNARVKTWRRLQEIGAVPTRTSVYVLPNTEQCRADFGWLRREIAGLGGDAIVFSAEPRDARESRRLVAAFRSAREEDYRALSVQARRLAATKHRRSTGGRSAARDRAIRNLRDRFNAIVRIDFFHARGRDNVNAVIGALERAITERTAAHMDDANGQSAAEFQNRCWVTRPRPSIDRISSAWLIRRFIDPLATFGFTLEPGPDDVPFDIPEIGFTHRGGLCTFETLVADFHIQDPVVIRISRIVHDLDLKDARFGVPETAAVGHVIDGLRRLYTDDHALIEQGISFFDAFAGSKSLVEVSK
jgi:hypothetical protein